MATVTGKVTAPFTYKGESYDIDDEVKLDVKHAARYEKLNYVKLSKEAEKKVEAAQTKESAPTPKEVKTK